MFTYKTISFPGAKLLATIATIATLAVSLFIISSSTATAAHPCVTNPQDGLCDLSVTVNPVSASVPVGGNTDVMVVIDGILQYEVKVIDIDVWMTDNVTGLNSYNLSWTSPWPTYGGGVTVNTGPLTNPVTVHATVENYQGTVANASALISTYGGGTVNVTTNNPSASWTITRPVGVPLTGSGTTGTYNNQPTGMYTITWGSVPGFTTPAPASLSLASNGTLTFPEGTYNLSANFQITAEVNNAPYGSISPSGIVNVLSGGNQSFTTTLAVPTRRLAWYHIDGNTHVAPTNNPYTFTNVLSNRSITSVLWPYANLGGITTPTGVTATPQACGGIVVSWNPVANATAGYAVFEGVPTDPVMLATNYVGMATTMTRTASLVPGNRYCFSVEASNTYDSVPSVPVCATAPAPCAPPAINLNFTQ